MTSRGDKTTFSRESKYYPLHAHLARLSKLERLDMEFAEVEDILGQGLPRGARSHQAWWRNGRSGHSQSRAWLLAGGGLPTLISQARESRSSGPFRWDSRGDSSHYPRVGIIALSDHGDERIASVSSCTSVIQLFSSNSARSNLRTRAFSVTMRILSSGKPSGRVASISTVMRSSPVSGSARWGRISCWSLVRSRP